MKVMKLVSLLSIACSAVVSAETQDSGKQLQVYPKNLARQHLGANLFHFDEKAQTFVPTEAAAAWLDDDVTSAAPVLAGKQYYMLALPHPELITNFQLSSRATAGSVSLYAADEVAVPGDKAWAPLVKDAPVESLNDAKLKKPLSRVAKYLLIETNISEAAPVFSLYAYTDKPAVAYDLNKRDKEIDPKAIYGAYISDKSAFNVAGLYAQSYVSYADTPADFVSWQKAIDDNPQSGIPLAPSTDKSALVIKSGTSRTVNRVATKVKPGTAGKLSLYLAKAEGESSADAPVAQGTAVSLADRTPAAVLEIDGTADRQTFDVPETDATEMIVKWEPANGVDPLEVYELNAFGNGDLATYAVVMGPDAIAELGKDASKDGKTFRDGKTYADGKSGKDLLEPIAEGPDAIAAPPQPGPYLPGSLGFPPNIAGLVPPVAVLPPEEVVSP